MQGDDVGALEQLVERDVLHRIDQCKFLVGIGVVAQDGHAEARKHAHQDLGNLAGTDHAECLAVEVEAEQTLQ